MKPERGSRHIILVVALVLPLTIVASSGESPYITIPALGRIAGFGYLYNQQTGEIRSSSVFRTSNLPSTSIITTELHSTFTEAGITTKFAEKLQLLNIDANQGANILSGLVKVRGSARILKDQQTSDEELTGILHYHHHTVDQDLQMFSDALGEVYNKDLLNHREATHFVSGISWGLNAGVTFKEIATQHKSKTDVRHELEIEFDALRENSLEVIDSKSNFSMLVYSDIALSISEKPTTRRELQNIQNQIQLSITNTNDGKGIPIEYKLTPISAIRNYLNVPERFKVFAEDISDSTLGKVFPIFDEIANAELQLKNLQTRIQSNSICVHQNTIDNINELNSNFTEFKNSYQEKFQKTLKSVRAGSNSSDELLVLANSFRLSDFSGTRMRRSLAAFKDALDKIDFCNNLKELSPEIQYFGAVDDLNSKLFQNRNKSIFSLFYKSEFIKKDRTAFNTNLHILLSFLERPNSKLFAVDCDFDLGLCESINNTTIKQFVNGIIITSDFIQETKAQETKCEEQFRLLSEQFTAAQNVINGTMEDIQNNLGALQNTLNATISDIQHNLGEFTAHQNITHATFEETQNMLVIITTKQNITEEAVHQIQNNIKQFTAAQQVINGTIEEINNNLGDLQNNLNATFDDILNNLEEFTAHQKITNATFEETQNMLVIIRTKQNITEKAVQEVQNNMRKLEIQYAALNLTGQTNRAEIQSLIEEINIVTNDCNPNNCENGGTCINGLKSFTCLCPPNYTGETCQTVVNECLLEPNICQNGGTCSNLNGSYSCVCPRAWAGLDCEVNIDDCLNVTCQNGGTCQDRIGDFLCLCLPGFGGPTCSQLTSIQCPFAMEDSWISVNGNNNGLETLNCSGLISLPSQGSSVLLEYKSNETYNNNERCLWTLDGSSNGMRYANVKLRVSMLCDGFGNRHDVLFLYSNKLDSNHRNLATSSHLLHPNTPFETTGMSGSYLSFTSDHSTTGYGFIIEIKVLQLAGLGSYRGNNFFYFTSPGKFTRGQYLAYEQTTIGISPTNSTNFIVNYFSNENCCGCDNWKIYEIQQGGVLFSKGRSCSSTDTLPLTFTTTNPILAVFSSDSSVSSRNFEISWT